MTEQYQNPQTPTVLGGARNPEHVSLEDQQRHHQAVRQWQDDQAKNLKRLAFRARVRNTLIIAAGSALVLAFLYVRVQAEPIDPPALILIPTALAVTLVASAAVMPPWRDVSQMLRMHKRVRRAEQKRERRRGRKG